MNGEFRRGWRALVASILGNAGGILSITFYTQGLFAGPVSAEFGWSRSDFFLGFTIMQFCGLITAPLTGTIVDRFGPRIVGIVGLIGHATMYLVLALNPGSLWAFYLSFAGLAVFAAGSLPVTWTTVVNSWFHVHRGMAIGLTMAGIGLAALLAPPLTEFFMASAGWRVAYAGIGLSALALSLPAVLLHLRLAPEAGTTAHSTDPAPVQWGPTRAEAMRDYRFWTLGAALLVITLSVIGLIPNFVPLLLDTGWTPAEAAQAATLLGVAVIVGRLMVGFLVDRIWAPAVAGLFFAGPAVAMVLMASQPITPALALVAAVLLGLAAGAELDLLAYLTSRYFGTRHYGAVFGGIYAFFTVGSGLAPLIYARVFDMLGTYRPMLAVAAIAIVVAVGLLLALGAYPPGIATKLTMEHPRKLVHVSLQAIRWGDMDAYEHVNNTIYFRYMEQARVEWLETVGYQCNPKQEAPVIVHADCSFLLPLNYPGTVEVRLFAGQAGRSSLPTFYELRLQGDEKLHAEGSAKIVWINPASGKSVSLPESLRRLAAG